MRLAPRSSWLLAWMLPALSVGLVGLAGLVVVLALSAGWGVDLGPLLPNVVMVVMVSLSFPVVGALIAHRYPANPVGWLLTAIGLLGAAALVLMALAGLEPPVPGGTWMGLVSSWLFAALLGALVLALLYFPDGRLPSRAWRVVVWLVLAGVPTIMATELAVVLVGVELPSNLFLGAVGWWLQWLAGLGATASLVLRFVRARGEQREQLKWLAFTVCLVVIAWVATAASYTEDRGNAPLASAALVLGLLAIPVSIGIAILRYRLYDVDLLINRTLIYGLLTVTLGVGYIAVVLLLGGLFGGQSSAIVAVATLAAAAAFQPLRRRVQDLVNRRFNREKYLAAQTIAAFGARLRQQIDLATLTRELVEVVDQTMVPSSVTLWTVGQPTGAPSLRLVERRPAAPPPDGEIELDDPLCGRLLHGDGAVRMGSLDGFSSAGVLALKAAGTELVVPLVAQGELTGLLGLGPRRTRQPYSADDRRLMNDLAGHAAPAVQVAYMVRQRQEEARRQETIEQELRLARRIQLQLLPNDLPDLPGWQVAATYRPARAVGGDFYDFIELPDGLLGVVMGDVTDKGVPAALVMATTRAILRAEAPRLMAPAEVLARVNDLLVDETPAHMFATCLYAVLDPASGRLRFANAGHNLPYLRTEDATTELRATGMPLGLLPGQGYDEREAAVAPGDRLLLYSDGLTEAHGAGGEMFGTPRVAALAGGSGPDGELIERLLDELARFTGPDWEQEDDITLVTLQRAAVAAPAAARRGPEEVLAEFELPSVRGNERLAADGVAEAVRPLDLPEPVLRRLGTAVAEATMNAIEHGNRSRAELPVTVRVAASETELLVRVTDRGTGPSSEPEAPDLDAKLAGRQSPRGWGLLLMRNMVDELRTTDDGEHHTVELVLRRRALADATTDGTAKEER